MQTLLATQYGWCSESMLVLAFGAALIVGVAAILARRLASATLQAAVWQVALAGLVLWLAVEVSGVAQAVWGLVRLEMTPRAVSTTQAVPADAQSVPVLVEFEASDQPAVEFEQAAIAAAAMWPEPAVESPVVTKAPWPWWPGAIWLTGALVVAGWVLRSRVALARFVRRQPLLRDEALALRVAEVASRLGIRREVRLLEAKGLTAPVAFGVFFPSVAIPSRFLGDFDSHQQRAILAHELAHLAARDPAWQLLADLVCGLLWWHPAAWWLRHSLRWASEAAADEASAVLPEGPSILAGCLVALGRQLGRPRQLVWLSAEGNGFRSGLGRRVERLLNPEGWAKRRPGRGRLAAVRAGLPGSLVLLAVLGTAWARPQALAMEGQNMFGVLRSSWQSSLGAVALAALLAPGVRDAAADEGRPAPKEKPPVAREPGPPAKPNMPPPPFARDAGRPEPGQRPPKTGEGPFGRERPGADAIQGRLKDIRQRLERLREEGKMEEADRLKEEARDLMRRVEGMREGFRGPGGAGPEGRHEMPEGMRKSIHLRMAMENLRAAGLNEMADKVRDQLQAIEREHPDWKRPDGWRPWARGPRDQFQPGGPEGDRPRGPFPPGGPEGMRMPRGQVQPGGPEGPDARHATLPPGGPEGARMPRGQVRPVAPEGPRPPLPELQQLREQMERMHREIQEMREQLKQHR